MNTLILTVVGLAVAALFARSAGVRGVLRGLIFLVALGASLVTVGLWVWFVWAKLGHKSDAPAILIFASIFSGMLAWFSWRMLDLARTRDTPER